MKKIIIIFLAALAFSCDSPNRSSDRSTGTESEENAPAEPDTASVHTDTTTSGGMNRPNQYDTIK